jgi:protein-S-isoprenylcysteine O-methyltransferase Ste14
MSLDNQLKNQGQWLFRWRSHLPLLLLPLLVIGLRQGEFIESYFGETSEIIWKGFCLFTSFLGLSIRCWVTGYAPAGTSGRNTKKQKAEELNTTGCYSLVRNPLYLGNFLMILGVAFITEIWWFVIILSLAYALYYERIIMAEEAFLRQKFGEAFTSWAEKTPAFFPRLYGYQSPSLSFSIRHVLKREHTGLLVIGLGFAFVEVIAEGLVEHNRYALWEWGLFALFNVAAYLFLRALKKQTHLLDVVGR